jgi:hypothetical protein
VFRSSGFSGLVYLHILKEKSWPWDPNLKIYAPNTQFEICGIDFSTCGIMSELKLWNFSDFRIFY